MIKLSFRITEEPIGICIYDESEFSPDATAQERQKFDLFMEAFKAVVIKETERLSNKGCGKTLIGDEATAKLGLTSDDHFKNTTDCS